MVTGFFCDEFLGFIHFISSRPYFSRSLFPILVFIPFRCGARTSLLAIYCFSITLAASPLYSINSSYWSIAIGVQLYALYPLVIALATLFGWKRSLVGIASIEVTLRLADGVLWTVSGKGLPFCLSGSPLIYLFSWSLGAYVAERHIRGTIHSIPNYSLYSIGTAAVASCFIKPLYSIAPFRPQRGNCVPSAGSRSISLHQRGRALGLA
jgi:peptidoglycan/LPS O-acetylase OafA/YrhL